MIWDQVIITAIYSVAFLCLFAFGELLYHYFKLNVEITRKFVHVFTGIICLTFPLFITTHWAVLFLTISFALILILSIRFNLLKSINAVNRKTIGSYLFPISIYVIYWSYSYLGHDSTMAIDVVWKSDATISGMLSDKAGIFYFLPLLIFSISDPLAAIVGKKWPIGKYTLLKDSKTLVGSGAFLISSFGISLLFMVHQDFSIILSISIAFAVSLATTIAEGISQKGLDNLFIPVSAIFILALFF